MGRAFFALPAFVVCLAVSPAAPKPKDDGKPDYYPTQLGTRWEYKVVGELTLTMVVTDLEKKEGGTVATLETKIGERVVGTERVAVSDKGVFRVEVDKTALNPPTTILPNPVRAGQLWASKFGSPAINMAFTVRGLEWVEVPLGKYKALRVDGAGEIAGARTDVTYWYAPDLGLVRMKRATAGTDSVLELKAFTPGKD